jgi:hypothetical protein
MKKKFHFTSFLYFISVPFGNWKIYLSLSAFCRTHIKRATPTEKLFSRRLRRRLLLAQPFANWWYFSWQESYTESKAIALLTKLMILRFSFLDKRLTNLRRRKILPRHNHEMKFYVHFLSLLNLLKFMSACRKFHKKPTKEGKSTDEWKKHKLISCPFNVLPFVATKCCRIDGHEKAGVDFAKRNAHR